MSDRSRWLMLLSSTLSLLVCCLPVLSMSDERVLELPVVIVDSFISLGLPWWLRGLKRLPAMQETWVRSLGWEDPLEKEMATHSSILAWEIPWMVKSAGLQSTGSQRVRHNWVTSLSLLLLFAVLSGFAWHSVRLCC